MALSRVRKFLLLTLLVVGAASTLLVVDVLAGVLYVSISGADTRMSYWQQPTNPERYRWGWPAELPARAGLDWFDDYIVEFARANRVRYEPFTGWRTADLSGQHINVVNGLRASYRARALPPEPIQVFFFGNSTMWGWGARDGYTIPSIFARLAEADGIPVEVTNYAETGWASWQDVLEIARLMASRTKPDLAIQMQGATTEVLLRMFSDRRLPLLAHYDQPEIAELLERPDDLARTFRRYNGMRILFDRFSSPPKGTLPDIPPASQEMLADALASYRASMDAASRLARSHGFQMLFFLQPSVFSKQPRPDEQRLAKYEGIGQSVKAFDSAITEPEVVKLGDVFDGLDRSVMLDSIHWNEAGAQAIAEAMYTRARPVLEEIMLKRGLRRTEAGASAPGH
jgi:lysophospholipase L1-like esterase